MGAAFTAYANYRIAHRPLTRSYSASNAVGITRRPRLSYDQLLTVSGSTHTLRLVFRFRKYNSAVYDRQQTTPPMSRCKSPP